MKIAFVNDSFLIGQGADHVVYELSKRLGRKHDVSVVCGKSDFKPENFKIIEINSEKLLTGSWKDILLPFKIFKYRSILY